MSGETKDGSALECYSCGRRDVPGDGGAAPILSMGARWCLYCAAIGTTAEGRKFVNHPSPGRMAEAKFAGPLSAMYDCYRMQPKKRIRVKQAKSEIQRAWLRWDGDKSGNMAIVAFFGWLQQHRPYFLTFRVKGDPWQRVHGWLLQIERERRKESPRGR